MQIRRWKLLFVSALTLTPGGRREATWKSVSRACSALRRGAQCVLYDCPGHPLGGCATARHSVILSEVISSWVQPGTVSSSSCTSGKGLHLRNTAPRLQALVRAMIVHGSFPAGVHLLPHFEAAVLSQHSQRSKAGRESPYSEGTEKLQNLKMALL